MHKTQLLCYRIGVMEKITANMRWLTITTQGSVHETFFTAQWIKLGQEFRRKNQEAVMSSHVLGLTSDKNLSKNSKIWFKEKWRSYLAVSRFCGVVVLTSFYRPWFDPWWNFIYFFLFLTLVFVCKCLSLNQKMFNI